MGTLNDVFGGARFNETTGAIVGGVIGFFVGGGWVGAAKGAAYGASLGYSYRSQRKQRRQIEDAVDAAQAEANRLDVRATGANQSISIAYGLNYLQTLPVYNKVFNRDYNIRESYTSNNGNEQRFGYAITGSSNVPNELYPGSPPTYTFLGTPTSFAFVTNKVLCKAPIAGVSTLTINNVPYSGYESDDEDSLKKDSGNFSIYMKINSPPESGLMKGGFTNRDYAIDNTVRDDNDFGHAMSTKAAGLVRAAEVYIKDRDGGPRLFAQIPQTGYFGRGRKVRHIEFKDGEYTVGEDIDANRHEERSHNTVLVLLDYLLDEDGPNYTPDEIDLESFYKAAEICDQVVKKVDIDFRGDVSRNLAFQNHDSFGQRLDDLSDKYDGDNSPTTLAELNLVKDFAQVSSYFKTFNFQKDDPDYMKYTLHKHEYHGQIYIDEIHKDNIARILDSIPGAQMVLRNRKISMFIPDESMTTDQHVVDEITDEDLHDYVIIKGATSDARANRMVLSFRNVLKNHTEDDVTVNNEEYLDEDSSNLLEESDNAPGVVFEDSAQYIAGVRLTESRNSIYTIVTKTNKLLLTEGDVIRLRVQKQDLEEVVLITSKRTSGSQLQFTAENFDISTYTWATHVKEDESDE